MSIPREEPPEMFKFSVNIKEMAIKNDLKPKRPNLRGCFSFQRRGHDKLLIGWSHPHLKDVVVLEEDIKL